MIIKFFEKFFAGMDYCMVSFGSKVSKFLNYMKHVRNSFFSVSIEFFDFIIKPSSFRRRPPSIPPIMQTTSLRSAEEQLDSLLLDEDRSTNVPNLPNIPRPLLRRPDIPTPAPWTLPSPPPDFARRPPPPSRMIHEARTFSVTTNLGAQDEYRFQIRLTESTDRHCVTCLSGYLKDDDDKSRCWCPSSIHYGNIIFSNRICNGWTAPPIVVPLQKSRSIRCIRSL